MTQSRGASVGCARWSMAWRPRTAWACCTKGISPWTVFITKGRLGQAFGLCHAGLRTADSELKSQMFDGYAAPEQYAVAEFDGKYTDIYGLGALFYPRAHGQDARAGKPAPDERYPAAPPIRWIRRSWLCLSGHRAGHAPCSRRAHAVCVRPSWWRITAPEKDEGGFRLTQRQIKFLRWARRGLCWWRRCPSGPSCPPPVVEKHLHRRRPPCPSGNLREFRAVPEVEIL